MCNPFILEDGQVATISVKIKCGNLNCDCYPFVCFICKVCRERWWSHCHRGTPPRGVCSSCWNQERDLTEWTLKLKESRGEIVRESEEWWKIFAKGIKPENYCYHSNEPIPFVAEIIKGCCRKLLKGVRCDSPRIKDINWHSYVLRQKDKSKHRPPEEYSCCREDGTPRGSKHPSRRARQRSNKLWRVEPKSWDYKAMLEVLPQGW